MAIRFPFLAASPSVIVMKPNRLEQVTASTRCRKIAP
jgi:hypothetical protein